MLCQRCKCEIEEMGQIPIPPVGDLDPAALPSVLVRDLCLLPPFGGVYFAFRLDEICYIGLAENILTRWRHHPHLERLQFELNARIAWVPVADPKARREYEKAAIKRFRPLWNKGGEEYLFGYERKEHIARRYVLSRTSWAFNPELCPDWLCQSLN